MTDEPTDDEISDESLHDEPVDDESPDDDETSDDETSAPVDSSVYRRRRIGVAAGAVVVVAALVGGVAVATGDGDRPLAGAAVSTTTTTTTTSTTVPPTTTTSTTTTTTSSTTTTTVPPPPTTILDPNGVPIWPPYEALPPLDGVAALTGSPAEPDVTRRPILAVKIDNRNQGRPQWGLDVADAIIEENVEGITRFVALFHTILPDRVGPVRSARTGDLDILAGMNRPVLGWSGGNPGVTAWIGSAASSRLLVDFSAQNNPCYERSSSRRAPHNLLLDPACAVTTAIEPGPARPLWAIENDWAPPENFVVTPDTSFEVAMDNVRVGWTWNPELRAYLRSQNGKAHLGISGNQIAMNNVVEVYTAHPPSPVDSRSPNPITVGFGRAVVHRDGVAIEGVWTRATPYDPFTFIDAASEQPILLDEGRTFVELARN